MNKVWIFRILLVLAVLFGFVAHGAYDKARGADKGVCMVADPDLMCWTAKHAAHEFRNGYYTRSHGVPASKVFAQPHRAKTIFAHKIATWVTNHPHKAQLASVNMGRHRPGSGDPNACPPDVTGLACDVWQEVMFESTCVSMAPDPTNAPAICHIFEQPYIDTDTVKRAGQVFFCGGSVIIGVAASPESGGGTMFIAGWGATACGWSLWSSF